MLHTYKSNSLSILAEKLADELNRRQPTDPIEPVRVIVPNMDTSRWLKLILSEKNGIAANYRFILPADWQFQQIRKSYDNLPSVLPSDPGPLTWSVFDLLMDEKKRAKFSRPDRYISMQPAEMEDQAAMQLAGKIASVFDQYVVYRPEMITGWQNGKIGSDPDEQWQARLWNELESERKKREGGKGFPNKAELITEAIRDLRSGKVEHPEPVYVFNTGLIPAPIIQMVQSLADKTDVLVFRCCTQNAGNPRRDDGNPLMYAFGQEAKGIEMLYNFSNGNVMDVFAEPDGKPQNLLEQIKESILYDSPIGTFNGEETGIEIRSCHTPLREIEVLYQFLLRQFEQNPDLHPDDVLVVTPDLDTYKPFIHAVFGTKQQGIPQIPYHAGYDSGSDSGIKRVLLHLLEVVDSRLKFAVVLDLFSEDSVRERFGVTETGAQRVRRWMEENNVLWGLDAEHRRSSGQPESDLHTWRSALRRCWKGMLMGSNEDPFQQEDFHYAEIQGRDREEDWSSFSAFLNKLQQCSDEARRRKQVQDWCSFTGNMMDTFCSGESLKERGADGIRRALDKSREAADVSGIGRKISYSIFRSQIRNLLKTESASTAIFTQGVTFSSMVPVRSIPAKIIALIGLNESDFPRKPKLADFDLMARNPEPTDRNRKNEDRNLFLESIVAAQKVHYCSYIGRSRVDNEPIPPSPIVSEWINRMAAAMDKKPEEIVVQEPLHGFSAENFRQMRSYAKTEYLTSIMIRQNRGHGRGLQLAGSLPEPEKSSLIQLDDLVRFYSNPVSSFFKSRFNPEINRSSEQRKEFSLNALERHKLFEQVFGWRLADRDDVQIQRILYQTGAVPQGWQGETILRDMIRSVNSAIELAGERGFEPKMTDVDLEIIHDDFVIAGSLLSYSEEQFLDITSSSYSGAKAFKSWIKHLCAGMSGRFSKQTSCFLCDLKKEKPTWITFSPCDNAAQQVQKLVEIYRRGNRSPAMIFPATVYEYQKEIFRGNNDPEGKAADEFEATEHKKFAENSDFYLSLLTGEEPDFEESFIDPEFQPLIDTMLNHLEPVK